MIVRIKNILCVVGLIATIMVWQSTPVIAASVPPAINDQRTVQVTAQDAEANQDASIIDTVRQINTDMMQIHSDTSDRLIQLIELIQKTQSVSEFLAGLTGLISGLLLAVIFSVVGGRI